LRVGAVGIQRIGNGEGGVVSVGWIQVVCDVGEAVFEDANFSYQGLHSRLVPLDAGLLLAEVGRHGCHCTACFVEYDFGSLGMELAPHDCALARYDMFGAVVVDVGLEV
jgi:hypothetical protein